MFYSATDENKMSLLVSVLNMWPRFQIVHVYGHSCCPIELYKRARGFITHQSLFTSKALQEIYETSICEKKHVKCALIQAARTVGFTMSALFKGT